MNDESHTREDLLQEVRDLRARVTELETTEIAHQKAEADLRSAKEYVETLIQSSLDMIVAVGANRRITEFNPAAEKAFGYQRAEVIGQPVDMLYDDFSMGAELNRQITTTGKYLGEVRNKRKNGELFDVYLEASLVRDTAGQVVGVMGLSRDISEQKRIDAALRESEEKYRDLVENISDIIYTLDAAGTLTYMSPVVSHLGGFTAEEITGRPFAEFIHPEDLPALLESFQQTLTGNLAPSEFRVLRKAGDYIWVRSASRLIVQNGEVVGLRGVLTDITERKRAEDALRESEQRYRNLFENANDAIASFTLDTVITSVNGGAERMTGWTREEVVGQHVRKIATPASVALAEERTRRFLAGDKPKSSTFEAELIHKDGHIVPIEARTRAIRDRNGAPIGFQGIYRDFSAKKALDKQREDFLAMLAHDIKNPLRGCEKTSL